MGTSPLPEAQLDRFLMRLSLGFPDRASERTLLCAGFDPTLDSSLPRLALEALMRAADVPARVVSGNQGGHVAQLIGGSTCLELRQSDAHAWVSCG